jgi:hypothetical protein
VYVCIRLNVSSFVRGSSGMLPTTKWAYTCNLQTKLFRARPK